MARHYFTKDFFRRMPNALLARYFLERGLFGNLDSSDLEKGEPGGLSEVWPDLPVGSHNTINGEIRKVLSIAA